MISLQNVIKEAEMRGLAMNEVIYRDVEVCKGCEKILFIDDEAYESAKGDALCSACACLCECCNQYTIKEVK